MLLDAIRKDITPFFYMNTGTLFDLYTGVFKQGTEGKWVLDGGLSQCLGIMGRGQTYKSGLAGSLLANAMVTNPTAEAYVYETEGTVADEHRYDQFVAKDTPVSDRIVFKNTTTGSLTDFYEDFNNIVKDKIEHKKDYLVESPFLDPKTGKPFRTWVPTFVLVDSFSKASVTKGDEALTENAIDDSALNTLYMLNGNAKTKIMSDLPSKAMRAGIYCIMTAHVGDKIDLGYMPTPKQMQYMKQSDKLKNVGSNFTFLTTALIQTLKATVMQNSTKGCEYPTRFSTDVEVNYVETAMVRCKNNASGTQLPFVVSQYQGILNAVTNFEFLRNHKNFGLNVKGNNQFFSPVIASDKSVSKNNIRETTDIDYELRRALELIAQLCFVQNMWNTWNLPEYVNMNIDTFVELLSKSEKCGISRVLNSTGVWSTAPQERERLTLMDVLMFLDSESKHPIVGVPKK